MKLESKRERLSRATKRVKRSNPQLTWQQAKERAVRWCTAMWPRDFEVSK